MKTHSQENYHICPYSDCGKRYAHEYKLKNHIASHHEKNSAEVVKYTPPFEKPVKTPKPASAAYSASSDRPFTCPYEGCDKAYIHEYKLNLHLRREHPGHYAEENAKTPQPNNVDNEMDEASDQDAYAYKRSTGKNLKQSRPKPNIKLPPSKMTQRKSSGISPANVSMIKKPWPIKGDMYEEEDSEETEEDRDNGEDGLRYRENNEDDDEETDED
uniref:C2H2-type domain-containing protein n=2 Tax=Chenopodium quinoa TaxID=63459 RepID=A0A803N648_CHEQI